LGGILMRAWIVKVLVLPPCSTPVNHTVMLCFIVCTFLKVETVSPFFGSGNHEVGHAQAAKG
jgi:hypothetical protein